MIRKYYSFEECFSEAFNTFKPYQADTFEEVFEIVVKNSSYINFDYTNENLNILWQELYARYYLKAINFIDYNSKKEMEEAEGSMGEANKLISFFNLFFYRVISIINRTNDYYLTLLNGYTSAKDNLLNDIKTTTKNLSTYNDTPQGETEGTSYLGDDYLTRVNQGTSEVSTNLTTMMNRLSEIQNSYKSILNDWVDEFKGLFLEENL